jgi:putative membrane fusion protein
MEQELLSRRERLKRREKAQRVRRKVFIVFALIVGVFVLIWTVGTVQRLINWNRMELVSVRQGVLEETVMKKSVVIRKETVLTVPQSASIKYVVEDNSRVRVGALLLKIPSAEVNRTSQDSDYSMYAPVAGTVSKKFDGLESVLTPSTLDSLDLESVYDKVVEGTFTGKAPEGEPAIRIVDNLSPAYICFPKDGVTLEEEGSARLRIPGSNQIISGKVAKISGSIAVVRVAPVPNRMIGERICDIEVINRRAEGMIVPSSSLVEEDGTKGLYSVSAGKMRFTETEILGIFGAQAVVRGLKPGQEIVVNPETISPKAKK